MRHVITEDVGRMKLDGRLLPGVPERLEVQGEVRVDREQIAGQSGSAKQPLGFEDAEITLVLRLPTDDQSTCYDKIAELASIFRSVDSMARPHVFRIVNKHVAAWGIGDVVFAGLKTAEDNEDDSARAELRFVEFRPVLVKKEAMVPPEPELPPGEVPDGVLEPDWTPARKLEAARSKLRLTPAVDDDVPPRVPRHQEV